MATETSPTESLTNTAQDYFEVNEAAQIMRISTRTLYRLIASKKLKKKKLLSRTVILKDDIKIFFAQQSVMKKKEQQRKEPIKIRQKELSNGNN